MTKFLPLLLVALSSCKSDLKVETSGFPSAVRAMIDTQAPIVDVGADIGTTGAFSKTATVSEDSHLTWTKVSGSGDVIFGSPNSLTTTFEASTEGAYVVRLTAVDEAGNTGSDEFSFTWGGPSFISLVLAGVATDGFINEAEKSDTNDIFTLTANNYTTAAYSNPLPISTVCDGSVSYPNTAMIRATDVSGDGAFVVCVRLVDAPGNVSYGKSASFTRDIVPPVFSALPLENEAANGFINLAESTSASSVVSLMASGYATAAYTSPLVDAGLVCDSSKTYAASIPKIDAIPAAAGSYAVCVRLQDAALNVTYGMSASIIKDLTAPTVNVGPSIMTKNASITIDATVSGADTYQWSTVSGPGTATFGAATAEDTTASVTVEGVYTLRLTATDLAGNSASDEMNYTYDITGPTFTSLARTGDASDGYINDVEKLGVTALWTLTASDENSTKYTLPLDDTSSVTCDALKTYNQTSIARAVDMMSGDVPYVICVRLTDIVGNITYGKSEVVTRDTTAPSVSVNADATAHAAFNATSTVSGASTYAWTKQSGSGSVTFGTASAANTTVSATADDDYVIRLTATDAAGNSAYAEFTLTWDFLPTVDLGDDISTGQMIVLNPTVNHAITYTWVVSAGTASEITFGTPNAAITSVSSSATTGSYLLRLSVADPQGNHAYDEINVTWAAGHRIFATVATLMAAANIKGGSDVVCQDEAEAASLPGVYKAVLSTSTENAKARFSIGSNLVLNTYGNIIAMNEADLWDGSIANPIGYYASGAPVSGVVYVWTGSDGNGAAVANTCSDWTSGATNTGARGITSSMTNWLNYDATSCKTTVGRLYCLSTASITNLTTRLGNTTGSVRVTYRLGSSVGTLARVDVRRVTGTSAPVDCSSGTVGVTFNSGIAANAFLSAEDSSVSLNTTYTYRACGYDGSNNLLWSEAANHSVTTEAVTEITNTDNGDGTWTLKLQPGPRHGKDNPVFRNDDKGSEATAYPNRDLMFRAYDALTAHQYSLIYFDIPTETIGNVVSAKVYLNFYNNETAITHNIGAYAITSSWVEGVSYASMPTYNGAALANTSVSSAALGWYAWDITSTAADWVTTPSSNRGLIFIPAISSLWGILYAYSAEAENPVNRPYLEIVYTP